MVIKLYFKYLLMSLFLLFILPFVVCAERVKQLNPQHLIAINSIQGSSGIKIKTDYKTLKLYGDIKKWAPAIELMPSSSHEINKTDNLKIAWSKMKVSHLYGYINDDMDHRKWNNNFKKFIMNVLELATRN